MITACIFLGQAKDQFAQLPFVAALDHIRNGGRKVEHGVIDGGHGICLPVNCLLKISDVLKHF
jgi:hypothetical protein